jgi:Mg2+ and Co2+ transporter CorA
MRRVQITWSKNLVLKGIMKLEGERFKLFKKSDTSLNLIQYFEIQKEIGQINAKLEQYNKILERMR